MSKKRKDKLDNELREARHNEMMQELDAEEKARNQITKNIK